MSLIDNWNVWRRRTSDMTSMDAEKQRSRAIDSMGPCQTMKITMRCRETVPHHHSVISLNPPCLCLAASSWGAEQGEPPCSSCLARLPISVSNSFPTKSRAAEWSGLSS